MKSTARRCSAFAVVAAMERASRHTPRPASANTAASPVGETDASPRFLLPFLRQYAEQTHTAAQAEPRASGNATDASSFLLAFIERAQADLEASSAQFQELCNAPQNDEGGVVRREDASGFAKASSLIDQHVEDAASALDDDRIPHDGEVAAAIDAFNPTINTALLQRVASRLAIPETLRMATQMVRYLREAGGAAEEEEREEAASFAAAEALLRRAIDVCRVRYESPSPAKQRAPLSLTRRLWECTLAARESAGIAARFHILAASASTHGQRRRRQPPRSYLQFTSDVQVSEILPGSDAVVVLTHLTHPEEVGEREAATLVHARGAEKTKSRRRGNAQKPTPAASFRSSLEECLAAAPDEVHLHCVLYREGVPTALAVARMVDSCEGRISAEDVAFSAEMPENDAYVVVQMCSVRVAVPLALREMARTEEAVQHCLHVAQALVQMNQSPSVEARVGLQLLSCCLHSCVGERICHRDGGSAGVQRQYAVLLRGVEQGGGPADQLDRLALSCSTAVPNFFPPHHFGSPAVPFFRTYHVAAAAESGRYAEAAAMLLCLEIGATPAAAASGPSPRAAWLVEGLHLLCSGEEREGAWQAWWNQRVPADVQARVLQAKAEVVWNVLASCRLHLLAASTGGSRDALAAATPEPGDFVRRLAPSSSDSTDEQEAHKDTAIPVYDQAQGARYTVHDLVLPLVRDARAGGGRMSCESIADVEAQLGFTTGHHQRQAVRQRASLHARQTAFRPLFIAATGFPRASRPWCRSFPEPSSTPLDSASVHNGGKGDAAVLSLATDWELASASSSASSEGRDYAAKSRGPRAQVWPVSKRGRSLADRLPVGLLAAASADGASLLGSGSRGGARGHTSRCLAIHCTLPADVSLGNYLCEFTLLDDLQTQPV